MSQNDFTLIGNLTRDPDLRYTSQNIPVANLGVASNRRYTTAAGAEVDEVMFMDVVAWRDLGTNANASLSKGDRVIVTGRIELHEFTTTKDGVETTQRRHRVIADSIGPDLRFAQADVKKLERESAPASDTPDPAPSASVPELTDADSPV